MENKEMRNKVMELAREGFRSGLNCAECVFDALSRAGVLKDVPKETIAMCVGFGGGIGMSGNTCGALSGAVLALGSVYGRKDPWSVPQEERGAQIAQKYYRRYNRLADDFKKANGSVLCREITAGHQGWGSKERRLLCMNVIIEGAGLAYDYLTIPQEEAFAMEYHDNMAGLK